MENNTNEHIFDVVKPSDWPLRSALWKDAAKGMIMHIYYMNKRRYILLTWLLCSLLLFFSCGKKATNEQKLTDSLNIISYLNHYRNLDSTLFYANKALSLSEGYSEGTAEALNNKAFVSIAKMQFDSATVFLDNIYSIGSGNIERLVADVQMMRLCQRQSYNKAFYQYRDQAQNRMKKLQQNSEDLSPHQMERLAYAATEYSIIASAYYYYVGLVDLSNEELEAIHPYHDFHGDNQQHLNYLYNIGVGGFFRNEDSKLIANKEIQFLVECYTLADRLHYPYWKANALQAISEHLQDKETANYLLNNNRETFAMLNPECVNDSLLAGLLAEKAHQLFSSYGDVYQTAGSLRTLSACYFSIEDYANALACLDEALSNKLIDHAPQQVATIREYLCRVYSAIGDKSSSDYNRNIYLDLQEISRQDRLLEARTEQLAKQSENLNRVLIVVSVLSILLLAIIAFYYFKRNTRSENDNIKYLLKPLNKWKDANVQYISEMKDLVEETKEEVEVTRRSIVSNKRTLMEQRAKLALVNTITPFIDRMLNEEKNLSDKQESTDVRNGRYEYIAELCEKIMKDNDLLTQWIQLSKGELSVKIESFPLNDILDMVSQSRMSFKIKGITLDVIPSEEVVKADKTLTLFMINTIADNARKFTPEGGKVTISSALKNDMVEISIKDTGEGITEEMLPTIFEHDIENNHGFGLLNCKGIIEKYKKVSKFFADCSIGVESQKGRGTRFFFTLPKGVARAITTIALILSSASYQALAHGLQGNDSTPKAITSHTNFGSAKTLNTSDTISLHATSHNENHEIIGNLQLRRAAIYADSAYYSNIDGTYEQTIVYADIAMKSINEYYISMMRCGELKSSRLSQTDTLSVYPTAKSDETQWFGDSIKIDYNVLLDLRNESAVAALALKQWDLYLYNNKIYTQLFKELSADHTLETYYQRMQSISLQKNIALWLSLALVVAIILCYYFFIYRYQKRYRKTVSKIMQVNDTLLSDNMSAQEKHTSVSSIDTSFMPSAIQQTLSDITSQLKDASELEQKNELEVELEADELKRLEYERSRLYVANNVMSNCLSTLKHETMYYPSRIRTLVEGKDSTLEDVVELTNYYKKLYTLLSMQAMRAVSGSKLQMSVIPLADIIQTSSKVRLKADRDMIAFLFELIGKEIGTRKIEAKVTLINDHYVSIDIPAPNLSLSESEAKEYFTPSSSRIVPLLCRQIVREIGEASSHRGCGIIAMLNPEGKIEIRLTLVYT